LVDEYKKWRKYNMNKERELRKLLKELEMKFQAAKEGGNVEEMRTILDEVKSVRSELDTLLEARQAFSLPPAANPLDTEPKEPTYHDAISNYIRSKGAIKEGLKAEAKGEGYLLRDIEGLKKENITATIKEDVSYVPRDEVHTVTDLSTLVDVFPVSNASGKYPILKNTNARMISVAELEKNPELAKPTFDEVSWEVNTYRGAIPISQEAIDDSEIDVVALVEKHIKRIELNTKNHLIFDVLSTFDVQTIEGLDDLKRLKNVELDPAYARTFVASQTFYNTVDTLKDSQGRYLLQDSITSPSGKVLLGYPVVVVSDEEFGEGKAFFGDLERAVIFPDRKKHSVRWVDNDIYGQYLQAAIRVGVAKADEKAGFMIEFDTP